MRLRPPANLEFSMIAVVSLALLSGGCGGTRMASSPTTPDDKPPPIADEPLKLIPPDAQQLLRVDLAELRGWGQYPPLANMAVNADCARGRSRMTELDRLDRLAIATLPGDPQPTVLIVVKGNLQGVTLEQVLSDLGLLAQLVGPEATPETELTPLRRSTQGRFEVATSGGISASKLDAHTMVFGDARAVEAALALANDPGAASLADSEVATRLQLTERTIGGFASPSARADQALKRASRRISDPKLGDALAGARMEYGLDLADGFRADLRVEVDTPQLAGELADRIQGALAQTTMFLRMFRLPPLAERLDVSIDDRTVVLQLLLEPADVSRLTMLAQTMGPPACPKDVPAPAQGGAK